MPCTTCSAIAPCSRGMKMPAGGRAGGLKRGDGVTGRSGPHVAVYGAKRTHLSWLRWCSPYRRPNPRQAILFAREMATPNESSGARRAREFSVGKAAAPHATRSSTVSTDATSLRSCPARERILSAS